MADTNQGVWSVSGTTATYKVENKAVATISNLKSGLKAVDGEIDGITVDGNTITLDKSVLGYTDVTLKNSNDGTFELELAGNYSVNTTTGGGWLVSGTTAYLLNGTSSGYAVTGTNKDTIKYTAAHPGDETLATLTGLKEGVGTDQDANIDGITVNGKTVTINSKNVIGDGELAIDSGYKLAVGDNLKPQPTGDVTWTVSKDTTASFTTKTTDSYTVDKTGTKLTHVEAGSATVTLSGLAKGTTADKLNGDSATVEDGVITLKSDVLGSKVTFKGDGYRLALADDEATNAVKATAADPVWNRNSKAKSATYDQVFSGKGKYYCDGTTIATLSKDEQTVTLATLSGLATDEEHSDAWDKEEEVEGIEVNNGVIKLKDPTMFTTSNITLGKNDAYSLAVTSDFDVYTSRLHWDYNSGRGGSAKIVRTTTAGYEQKDSKTVNYLKPTTTTLATVSGLTKGLDFDAYDVEEDKDDGDNSTGVATTGTIDGLEIGNGVITVSQGILEAGDTVIDKTADQKGVKKLSLGAKDAYKFEFADGVTEPEDQDAVWKLGYKAGKKATDPDTGTGTWTYSQDTTAGWEIDKSTKGASKTINYNAAKTTALATLSGVTTSLNFDNIEDGYVIASDNITADEDPVVEVIAPTTDSEGNTVKGKVVLNKLAFAGKKISLKSSDYTIGLDADYSVKDITEEDAKWVADTKGKAVLTGGKSAGYEVDTKTNTAINYTAPKVTAYATITGLKTSSTADEVDELGKALDIATDKAKKTIALTTDMMPSFTGDTAETDKEKKTKVALGSKDTYTFKLADGVSKYGLESKASLSVDKDSKGTPTGNASYKADMTAGYLTSSDSKTVNYKKEVEDATLFTLSGLKKDGSVVVDENSLGYNDAEENFVEAITINPDTKKVTLKDDTIFGGTKISLKNGSDSYTLEVDDALKDGDLSEPAWSISGGKATYYEGTKGGYVADAKGLSASYTKPKVETTLAEITGLSKNTSVKSFQINKSGSDNLILITTDAVTTSVAKLTKGDGYKLSLYGVPSPTSTDSDWTQKGTTATITRDTTDGWSTTSDGKTINYSKAKTETVVTVSGITQSVTDDNLIFDSDNKTVTVTNDKLLAGTKKVTIKSGIKGETYTFKLGSNVTTATTKDQQYWEVSGGKANYYRGDTPHYTLGKDDLSVEYVTYKPTSTLATVSGLKKTATADDFELENGVITLNPSAVDWTVKDITKTKVTLKGDDYTLAFDYASEDDDGNSFKKGELSKAWGEVKSGKILYESGIASESDEGFVVSADGKTAYYGKATDKKITLATLSTVSDSASLSEPDENGVITLGTSDLAGKKASLGSNDPYTLTLDSVDAPTASGEWTVDNKGTATLKGTKTAGYLKTDDKTVNYTAATAANKTEVLATVKGVEDSEIAPLSGSDKVDLSSVKLSDNVTVDGKGILAFDFGSHSDASITGSSSNDSLTFAGSGLTINPSKGNDYIDLGNSHSGADNLLYASGDGYDIVEGFQSTDKITVSKAKTAAVKQEDGNTIITIDNKGSITLKNFSGTPTIEGVTVTTASSDLLLDDNYSMDAAALSEIVTANTGSYSPYQFSNSLKLTKEENLLPAIAYASDKK